MGPLLVQALLQLLTGFGQVLHQCHPCPSERWKLPKGISWEPEGEETAPCGRVNFWLKTRHLGSSELYPHSPSWRDKNSYQVRILWCHPTSFWTENLTVFVTQPHLPHRHQIWTTPDLQPLNCLWVHRKGLLHCWCRHLVIFQGGRSRPWLPPGVWRLFHEAHQILMIRRRGLCTECGDRLPALFWPLSPSV